MSQAELARRLGINRDLMLKYETGDRAISPESLAKIVKELDVSIDSLFEVSPDLSAVPVDVGVEIGTYPVSTVAQERNYFIDEELILDLEKQCVIHRIVRPFFSAVLRIEEVKLEIEKAFHQSFKQIITEEQNRDIIKWHRVRQNEFLDGGYTLYQILSKDTLINFAKGTSFYAQKFSPEIRKRQFEFVIELIDNYPLQLNLGISEFFIVEYGIYDDDRLLIQTYNNFLIIKETQIIQQFLNEFAILWRNSIQGVGVKNFLQEQIEEIKRLEK
jgi:transcriptional regulator with XRE-family HTH domain